LGGPAITWIRMTNMLLGEAIHPRLVRQGMWGCALVALCIFPLAWLPLLLWTLGVIRAYEMALAISVIVGIVALIAGIWFVGRMGQLASLFAKTGQQHGA
jgi:hypothetical protein